MDDCKSYINFFLTEIYSDVMKAEETYTSNGRFSNLSLKEVHVIDAVCRSADQKSNNASSAIAQMLKVTAGTLTTAVNTLERKGYLCRERDAEDKRIVRLKATQIGWQVYADHQSFHAHLVDRVAGQLSLPEKRLLVQTLEKVEALVRDFEK